MQVLGQRRFDLQQATHALEGTLLPAGVAFQRGEELGRVDDEYLGRIGRFGLRTRLGEDERKSVERCVDSRRTEILEVLAIVVEHEEERARARH